MLEWLINISLPEAFGLVGVFLYIGGYFALQAGFIKGEGYIFAGINTAAASCVLLSLVQNFNLPSALIQIPYILISVFGIVRFYILSHRIQFTDEEKSFLHVVAPALPKLKARQLLNIGTWDTIHNNTKLANGGEINSHLYFLLSGSAVVSVAGNSVAELGEKSLIGEMSCLTGLPASATVTVNETSRIFAVEVNTLNNFLSKNVETRHELERGFANQIGNKLIQANQALSLSSLKANAEA